MPIIYKAHTIVAGAAPSQARDNYIPVVYIGWEIATERSTHLIVSCERFSTFEEATEFAYTEAKAWVERHATQLD